ncbi:MULTISPECIES: hypothetical protein [Pandoraea]|uniref:hypothetical protein n=1 Tax=Pandoraea TaxID=93217 RepID=UPI001F5D0942|nr:MULTISPECIES: hypothetical protein [Pandoraea]MCI3205815.1 hypothetical protein [Pandoraea sp. LA3]MDN4583843.1 hypothetical protein [Pandoraea capi]
MEVDTSDLDFVRRLQEVSARVEEERFAEIRVASELACARLREAEDLLWGVWVAVLSRTHGVKRNYTQKGAERDALYAMFKLGRSLVTRSIFEGRITQAMALVRQELELHAQLVAIGRGQRHAKKSAPISPLREDLRILYGELSQHAHLVSHDLPRSLSARCVDNADVNEQEHGTVFYPMARDVELTRRLYAIHIVLVKDVFLELAADTRSEHPESISESDFNTVMAAMDVCAEEGMVTEK